VTITLRPKPGRDSAYANLVDRAHWS